MRPEIIQPVTFSDQGRLLINYVVHGKPLPYPRLRPHASGRGVWLPGEFNARKNAIAAELYFAHLERARRYQFMEKKDRMRDLKTVRYALSLQVFTETDVGDLDNYTKTIKDAMAKAYLFANDKQIKSYWPPYNLSVDAKSPRMEVKLYEKLV